MHDAKYRTDARNPSKNRHNVVFSIPLSDNGVQRDPAFVLPSRLGKPLSDKDLLDRDLVSANWWGRFGGPFLSEIVITGLVTLACP
jgi:hypothetical protein